MKLVFQEAARQVFGADLRDIHDYIAIDNPAVAATVVRRIKSSLDRLHRQLSRALVKQNREWPKAYLRNLSIFPSIRCVQPPLSSSI